MTPTEKEIVSDALKAFPEYIATIRATGEFDMDKCLNYELRRVETIYRREKGLRPYSPLDKPTRTERDQYFAHFIPLLREATQPLMHRYLKGRRVQAINATMAKAVVTAALSGAGLKATVDGQRYRAKVAVQLSPHSQLSFYVRYKDLQEDGFMDGVIQAIADTREAISRLGDWAQVKRC